MNYLATLTIYVLAMIFVNLYKNRMKKKRTFCTGQKTIDRILNYSKNYDSTQYKDTVLPHYLRYFDKINLN